MDDSLEWLGRFTEENRKKEMEQYECLIQTPCITIVRRITGTSMCQKDSPITPLERKDTGTACAYKNAANG
jgi:hypothetical protein